MRERERQRHRQGEKQTPCREPDMGLFPDPRIMPWAKGRHSTAEPPRGPIPHLLYPFLCWRTSWLLPQFGYCGYCYHKHWGAGAPSFHYICIYGVNTQLCNCYVNYPLYHLNLIFWAAPVAQWFSTACSSRCDPGDRGSSPTSGSFHSMEPASPSVCVSASLSLSLSLSLCVCVSWINKIF